MPSQRRSTQPTCVDRRAKIPTTIATDRKNTSPLYSRMVGGAHSVTDVVIVLFVPIPTA